MDELTAKQFKKIKNTDINSFQQKNFDNTPPCYFCGDKHTFDFVVVENELKKVIYYRPIDGENHSVCLKHHLLAVKIDKIVTFFMKILFKLI